MRERSEFTAQDIMVSPVAMVFSGDTMQRAASVFLDKNISGAPVLNEKLHPVGVLTKTDITHYERDRVVVKSASGSRDALRTLGTIEAIAQCVGFHAEDEEDRVSEWMTPKVFSVDRNTLISDVVKEMVQRRIHRVFVRKNKGGAIIGVITAFDLIQLLEKTLKNGKIKGDHGYERYEK